MKSIGLIVLVEVGAFALSWIAGLFTAICIAPLFLALYLIENVHRHIFAPINIAPLGVVVITGAANGIGRATLHCLVNHGVTVVAVDVDEAALATLPNHPQVIKIRGDVTSNEDVDRIKELLVTQKKTVYGLINNAGVHHVFECAHTLSDGAIKRTFDINVVGAMRMVRALYPLMKKPGGRIINMGSVGGFIGSPYLGAYSASKFALQGYTETLRREVRDDGVSVIILNPYFVRTRAHDRLLNSNVSQLPRDFSKLQLSLESLQNRFMSAEDVVPDVMAALSDRWPRCSVIVALPIDRIVLRVISLVPNWCGAQDFLIRHLQSSFVYEYLRVSAAEAGTQIQSKAKKH